MPRGIPAIAAPKGLTPPSQRDARAPKRTGRWGPPAGVEFTSAIISVQCDSGGCDPDLIRITLDFLRIASEESPVVLFGILITRG